MGEPGTDAVAPRRAGPGAVPVRDACLGDVAALVALLESAYRGEDSHRGWTTEADFLAGSRTSAAEVEEVISAQRSAMLVAEQPGLGIVGCVRIESRPPAGAYLGMLAVRPDLQARGLGRALVGHAEVRARREWGALSVTMTVISRREELIAWYARLGYERTGETIPFDEYVDTDEPHPGLTFSVLRKALGDGPGA